MEELVEIHGILDKQIFKNKENGYSVFSLKINSKEKIVIQGLLPEIHLGEHATFKGKWVFHQKFGYGKIKRLEGSGDTQKLTIQFTKAGEKKLMTALANLESC